jgi:hypothetical protein
MSTNVVYVIFQVIEIGLSLLPADRTYSIKPRIEKVCGPRLLRRAPVSAQSRLRLKQRPLRMEAVTRAWGGEGGNLVSDYRGSLLDVSSAHDVALSICGRYNF